MIKGMNSLQRYRWPRPDVQVYMNPLVLPMDHHKVQEMVKDACFSLSLRTGINFDYRGAQDESKIDGAIVLSFFGADRIRSGYAGNYATGRSVHQLADGKIALANQVYMDGDFCAECGDDYTRRLILHELMHSAGAIGHLPPGEPNVLSHTVSGRPTRTKFSLADCNCFDQWNPHPVELHHDLSLTLPIVTDGSKRLWVELDYIGNGFLHRWKIARATAWDAPESDNVAISDSYATVIIQDVRGRQFSGAVKMEIEGDTLTLIEAHPAGSL